MLNKIIIGPENDPLYEFAAEVVGGTGTEIRRITSVRAVDIIGSELSIDQLTPRVDYDKDAAELFSPADYDGVLTSDGFLFATNRTFDDIRTLEYGTPVRYYRGGALFGKFYVKNVDRIAGEVYQINAMSAVGLLDAQQHNGGVYTGQTFRDVASEIIDGAVSFSCESDVASVTVFGWLPVASKRKNLHQLLFATGASLAKDANGDVRFVFLSGSTKTAVPDERIFMRGNVDYSDPATAVEITEHTFEALPSDETVTLFDNTNGSGAADRTRVTFRDAPVHDISATDGLAIVEAGANYAIISGTGILTGKPYTHIMRTVSKRSEGGSAEKVVPVTNATLVSVANSENVAKRVLAYYSSKKTVAASIVLDGETAGQQLEFSDPFGEASSGFLASMEINVSSNLKADCTLITDYAPTAQGNNYSTVTVLKRVGTFTVGENGAFAVLIGGGDGGYSGGDGYPGTAGTSRGSFPYPGGNGGVGGPGGNGGRILAVDLSPGFYVYDCGSGGKGGVSEGTEPTQGNKGTATTISKNGVLQFTSEDGTESNTGYLNLFTGEIYALSGEPGISGVAGGDRNRGDGRGESLEYGGATYYGGGPGADSDTYYGHTGYGGAGGGAALGLNGNDGMPGTADSNSGIGASNAGDGGAGADGADRINTKLMIGAGGDGGHGGGGGGAAGTAVGSSSSWPYGQGGPGGKGGSGGLGGDGGIILYQ